MKKLHEEKFFARLDRIAEHAADPQDGKNRPLAPLEEAKVQLAEMAKDFGCRRNNDAQPATWSSRCPETHPLYGGARGRIGRAKRIHA